MLLKSIKNQQLLKMLTTSNHIGFLMYFSKLLVLCKLTYINSFMVTNDLIFIRR